MISTEDRARAAMRAIGDAVRDAPPLELTASARDLRAAGDEVQFGGHGARRVSLRRPGGAARPGSRGRDRRWRSKLAPIAAAVAVAAVAIALVTIKDVPNGRVASPSPSTTSVGPATKNVSIPGVPEYYVAWMQASTPYLVVGDTATGRVGAVIKAPQNVNLQGVYGAAANDRTFIVTGYRHGADAGTVWYLLRIAPGSAKPARLTSLPVPVRQSPAVAALSPDGTQLAVALPGSPATLRVYSVATGALLRAWSTSASGELTAQKVTPGSRQFSATVLRWSPDGSQLAFAWNASTVRVLDPSAPDGDLITSSRLLSWIGIAYATLGNFTCDAAQGWAPITITKGSEAGQGVVCAGNTQSDRYTPCTSQTKSTCKYTQQTAIGFLRATHTAGGDSYMGLDIGSACDSRAEPVNGAYLGWSNSDGSEVLGSLVCGGHSRFGVFRGKTFTPLPALPHSLPLPAGVVDGIIAW